VVHVKQASGFRERLLPRWWAFGIALALVSMVAIAYGAALDPWFGWLTFACGGLAVSWLLWIASPVIQVTETSLLAGRARLPRSSIAGAIELDGPQAKAHRGPTADACTFVLLRPWRAATAVLVTLDDSSDPHPAWLLTSKYPDRLVRALQ
jgi:hypothetical protein